MRATLRIALNWAIRTFGREHVYNTHVRSLRVAEEAVELAQVCGVREEQMHKLVQIVYSRPPGLLTQEIAGVLMTVYVFAAAQGADPEEIFTDELLRVLQKPTEFYSKRNQEKIDLGLF